MKHKEYLDGPVDPKEFEAAWAQVQNYLTEEELELPASLQGAALLQLLDDVVQEEPEELAAEVTQLEPEQASADDKIVPLHTAPRRWMAAAAMLAVTVAVGIGYHRLEQQTGKDAAMPQAAAYQLEEIAEPSPEDYAPVLQALEKSKSPQLMQSGSRKNGGLNPNTGGGGSSTEALQMDGGKTDQDIRTGGAEGLSHWVPNTMQTDGTHIYGLQNGPDGSQSIAIIDAAELEVCSQLPLDVDGRVDDLYLTQDKLVVVSRDGIFNDSYGQLQERIAHTAAASQSPSEETSSEAGPSMAQRQLPVSTELLVYDISDAAAPVLSRTYEQDGLYQGARLEDDILYTVTRKHITADVRDPQEYLSDVIPIFYDSVLEAPLRYLSAEQIRVNDQLEYVEQYTIISAVPVGNLEPANTMALLGNIGETYLAEDAAYIAENMAVPDRGGKTSVSRIAWQGKELRLTEQCVLAGRVKALYQYENALQAVVSTADEKLLCLLDTQLKQQGELSGWSRQTEVCLQGAAAYVADWQNRTLQPADLSDPQKPAVLTELPLPQGAVGMQAVTDTLLALYGDAPNGQPQLTMLYTKDGAAETLGTLSLQKQDGTVLYPTSPTFDNLNYLPEQGLLLVPVAWEENSQIFRTGAAVLRCQLGESLEIVDLLEVPAQSDIEAHCVEKILLTEETLCLIAGNHMESYRLEDFSPRASLSL